MNFSKNGTIRSASRMYTPANVHLIELIASILARAGKRVRVSTSYLPSDGTPEKAIHLRYGKAIRNPNR